MLMMPVRRRRRCRIEEIENKIGAGLIEEVIQMAESELKLIEIMYKSKV